MDDEFAVALVPRDVLEQALQEVRWGLSTLCPGHRSTNGGVLGLSMCGDRGRVCYVNAVPQTLVAFEKPSSKYI